MNKADALKIINDEALSGYNLFEQHSERPNEVIIKFDNNSWLVYANDERGVTYGKIESFSNESDALEKFIKRLRGAKTSSNYSGTPKNKNSF